MCGTSAPVCLMPSSCCAWLTCRGVWRGSFLALKYAFELGSISTPAAQYLLRFPNLLKAGTAGSLAMELGSPLLVLSPISLFAGCHRALSVMILVAFHIGTGVFLCIGIFPWVGCCGLLPLFPPQFWDVLTDATAGVWHRVAPSTLPGVLDPPADSRDDGFPITPAITRQRSWLVRGLAAVSFTWLLWNVAPVTRSSLPLPVSSFINSYVLRPPALLLRLDQDWAMFSPKPPSDDGWWVFPGRLRDGRAVELFRPNGGPVRRHRTLPLALPRGENVSEARPPLLASAYFANDRWRKYLMNLNDVRWQAPRSTW